MATRGELPDGPATGQSSAAPPHRPGRRRRRMFFSVGGLLALLLLLLLLAPTLAGWYGRGYIESTINRSIPGRAQIGRLHLSWRGPQEAQGIMLLDPAGKQVAIIDVASSAGVWGLVTGRYDLGTVRIGGSADVVAEADGTTNLERALGVGRAASPTAGAPGSAPGSSSGPPQLPPTLAASVVMDKFEAAYTDPRLALSGHGPGGSLVVQLSSGSADFATGKPLKGATSFEVLTGPSRAEAKTASGSVTASWTIDSLTDAQGRLTTASASIDASATFTGLSVALADSLASQAGRLEAMLGLAMDMTLALTGSAADMRADLSASSPVFTADLGLQYTPAAFELARPGTIKTQTKGLAALAPGIIAETPDPDGAMLAVDQWPDVAVSIESMRLPLAGWSPDWAAATSKMTLQAGETTARVAVGRGEEAPARVINARLKPLTMILETQGLAKGARLKAESSVEVDGHKAGNLAIDLTATNIMRAGSGGAPAAFDLGGAMVDGVVTLAGFNTQVAQPFVQAMGVRLAQDVGPEVDLELTAAAKAGDGSLPETSVELRLNSRNVTATAEAMLERGTARTVGDGVKIEFRSAGPLVSRLAQKQGVRIQSGLPVRLTATDAHADLTRLLRPAAGPGAARTGPDLRGAGGTLTLWIGETSGTVLLTPGQPARTVHLPETTIALDTPNLAQGVNLRTTLKADIDGKPAGTITISAGAVGLLDDSGALRGVPAGPFRGRVTGQDVPTPLIQSVLPASVLEPSRLDLPTDLGPSADFSIVLTPVRDRPEATSIALSAQSEKLTFTASLLADADRVSLGNEQPTIATLRSAGTLAGRFLPAGLAAGKGGSATLSLEELSLPLRPTVDALAASGRGRLELAGLSLAPAQGPPLQISSATLHLGADGKGAARLGLDSRLRHGGQDFRALGDVQIDRLFAPSPQGGHRLDLASAVPTGSVTVHGAPFSLLAFAPSSDAAGSADAPDAGGLQSLLQDLLGKSVTVGLEAKSTDGKAGTDLKLTAESQNLRLDLPVHLGAKELRTADAQGKILLTPSAFATLISRYSPATSPAPALKAQASFALALKPTTIPRDARGLPTLAGAGPLAWTLSAPGSIVIENLSQAAGITGDSRPVGLSGLVISGSLPLGALAQGGSGKASATMTADLPGDGGKERLEGSFDAGLVSGRPKGPMSARLKVTGLDTQWADAIAKRPGLATGLLGKSAALDVAFAAEFAPAAGAKPPGGTELRNGTITASLASPTFSMSAPLAVLIRPDRFELASPTVAKASLSADWANQFILEAEATPVEGPPRPRVASFAGPSELTLNIAALVVSRGAGPMKPGVFSGRAIVDVPQVPMAVGDGVPVAFADVHLDVSAGEKPGTIGFNMVATEIVAGAQTKPDPIRFAGALYDSADAAGRPTFDAARITAKGHAPSISTAVIDALAGQDGLLLELLGPTVSMDVDLGGFGRDSGRISATAVSPRANGAIKGTIQDHVLVASEPVRIELKEVTPALGERLVKGLPLVGSFEKRPEDGPAILTAANLEAPLNHDLARLNADIVLDFGRARFETGRAFSTILKVVRANDTGEIGRRLEPLALTVRKGVFSYDRYTLPLGEFSVGTEGSVDMANRRLDLVTYIPLGALTDEAAGVFSTGLGRLIGGAVPFIEEATMVPWRTRGPMDNPSTTPELGLFLKNTGRTIFSPGTDLFNRLEDLFDGDKKDPPK